MTPASLCKWRMYLMISLICSSLTFLFWAGIAPESDPFNITLAILPLAKFFGLNFSWRNVGAPLPPIASGPWHCAQTLWKVVWPTWYSAGTVFFGSIAHPVNIIVNNNSRATDNVLTNDLSVFESVNEWLIILFKLAIHQSIYCFCSIAKYGFQVLFYPFPDNQIS